MKNVKLQFYQGPNEIAGAAAQCWLGVFRSSSKPLFCALAGGRIAGVFFSALAALIGPQSPILQDVHFFWADERCVPPSDPESNFGLAARYLLTPLLIPKNQIHAVPGALPQGEAASLASQELGTIVTRHSGGFPVLDLVFLSMGEDGHVASLFPGISPDPVSTEIYQGATAPSKLPRERVTLSYGMLTAARHLSILVSGTGKEEALRASLSGANTPLGQVLAQCREATVFTDLDRLRGLENR